MNVKVAFAMARLQDAAKELVWRVGIPTDTAFTGVLDCIRRKEYL